MSVRNKRAMHILVVTQYFWPENFRVNDLVEGLRERGHKVTVFTGLPNYPKGAFFRGYGWLGPYTETFKDDVRVARVPIVPRGTRKGLQLVLNYLSFVVFGCMLIFFRCREKYDSVFVYGISPITLAIPAIFFKWFRRVPVVFWVTDLWPESLQATHTVHSSFVLDLVSRMVRFIYKHCDKILVSGKGFISRVERLGVSRQKLEYFPQWAEAFFSEPTSIDSNIITRGEFPEGFVVLFAGNIGSAQSFDTIISAAELLKQHSDIHWVILGDGLLKEWVEAEVSARGLVSCFNVLGSRPIESMPTYYSMADALLVSLRADPVFAITVPGKLQTYMASAKPIIGSIDGEGAELIQLAGCGHTARAGCADELMSAVLKVYSLSVEERQAMGFRARRYFEEHFEREKALSRLENILFRLLGLDFGERSHFQ